MNVPLDGWVFSNVGPEIVFINYFDGLVVNLGQFVFVPSLIQVCWEGFGENTKINSLCGGVGD